MAYKNTEFLAFSGTMLMPVYWNNYEWSVAGREAYREALKKGAESIEGFTFLDLGGLWEAYVKKSKKPVSFFRRDHHHANEFGK